MPHDPYKKLYEDLKAEHETFLDERKRVDRAFIFLAILSAVVLLLAQAVN